MKKVLLAAVGLLLLTTMVYAQTPKVKPVDSSSARKSVAALIERSQGKIQSLQKVDPASGNFGKFTIVDASGKKRNFELIAKSQIYSNNSAQIAFSDLKKGDEIVVLYVVTLKGINDVITVTQTK